VLIAPGLSFHEDTTHVWRSNGYRRIPQPLRWPVVTLGVFDGVHRGHQAVLSEVVNWSRAQGGEALVITFHVHPRAILGKDRPPSITSLEHRLVLFERMGIDGAIVLRFTRQLAALSAAAFVERVLIGGLQARGVVLGFDSRFGQGARGDVSLLRRYQAQGRLQVRQARPAVYRGRPISSTAIRQAIGRCQLAAAARMLGRRVSVLGTVVRGDGRGRRLGWPTANLDLHHELAPPPGVYATWARIEQAWLPSVTSIGTRSTFHPRSALPTVEVHLLDGSHSLYGRAIELQFARRLRGQHRFESSASMVRQIERDVARCRRLLRTIEP